MPIFWYYNETHSKTGGDNQIYQSAYLLACLSSNLVEYQIVATGKPLFSAIDKHLLTKCSN